MAILAWPNTRQNAKSGLPGHSHANNVCYNRESDLHCETHDNGNYSDSFDFFDVHTAYINLRSERYDIRADYTDPLPGFEAIRLRASYTDHTSITQLCFEYLNNSAFHGQTSCQPLNNVNSRVLLLAYVTIKWY